jgi:hypothetical protein
VHPAPRRRPGFEVAGWPERIAHFEGMVGDLLKNPGIRRRVGFEV